MTEEKSLLSRIVTWTIIGILAVIALKLAVRLLSFVMGIVGFLLGIIFTFGPILLLGWIAVKAWKAFTKPTDSTAE